MKGIGTYKILTLASAVIILLSVSRASAQHYIGVRGGYGSGSSRLYPAKYENGTIWGLYNAGISWKFYTAERVAGGVEVDLLWMQQGFKTFAFTYIDPSNEDLGRERTSYYQRKVSSIVMPILWQPHLYMFDQKMRVFANLGVTFSYNMSAREETMTYSTGVKTSNDYTFKTVRDNRWGYGLCIGAGASWAIGRFEIFGEARYYLGFSDIQKSRAKYVNSGTGEYQHYDYLRTPLDGMQISAGCFFRLGKGGIRSPRSKAAQQKYDQRMLLIEQAELEKRMQQDSISALGIELDGEITDDTALPEGNVDPDSDTGKGRGKTGRSRRASKNEVPVVEDETDSTPGSGLPENGEEEGRQESVPEEPGAGSPDVEPVTQ